MASRRDPGGPRKLLETIREKQKHLQDAAFSSNYIGVQQALDKTKEKTSEIKGLKRKVEEAKKSKGQDSAADSLDAEYELLEDLALQKKRCLETLLYVSEVENILQNVQSEFEDRALYLTERRKVFESIYREDTVEASARIHRDCTYALRGSWNWLSQVTKCLQTHVTNAGEYHQFFHDVQFLDEDLGLFLKLMNSNTMRERVETQEADVMCKHLRNITNKLLDFQCRVDKLGNQAVEVYPIHLRRESCSYPLKAKALVFYCHEEVKLEFGEEVLVLDTTDQDKWQVRCNNGSETEVPGVILVIPPPDKKAVQQVQRIKEQLVIHWDTTLRRFRTQLIQFISNNIKDTQEKELSRISSGQKAELMRLMNEAVQLLRPLSVEDPDFKIMMANVTNFRKIISQVKSGDKDYTNGTTQKWQANAKVLVHYKEFLTYAKTYKQALAESREQEKLLLKGAGGQLYSSKAYFERTLPMVEVNTKSQETVITSVKSEMIIHERQKGKRPKPPPRRRRQLKRVMSSAVPNDVSSDLPECSEELQSFTITGVIDPRTKQRLTVFQAMAQGILDQANGTYTDPTTGKSMPIPEAIHRGLITVDTRENLPNGHSADDGFSPMRNTLETQIFPVAGVIDPRTGEWISVKEAVSLGILDPKSGKYKNIVTGEECDLLEAVKNGYLVVDPAVLEDTEKKDCFTFVDFADVGFRVTGVVDPTTGDEIPLKRAMTDGVIDLVNSLYRNPHTGETISIEDAIRQGLIRGTYLSPSEAAAGGPDVMILKQLQLKKQRYLPGDGEGGDSVDGSRQTPNAVMFDKLRARLDPEEQMVLDPNDLTSISLQEAYEKGVIDFEKGEYKLPNGDCLSLEQATARNFIEPELLQEILKVYQDCSVKNLTEEGKFDPETGLVIDPKSGNSMSLQSAIEQRVIDPNLVYFYDVPSQKITNLATAIENGSYDPSSGKYKHKKVPQALSLEQADKVGLVLCDIDPDKMTMDAKTLERLQKVMDTSIPFIPAPYSNGNCSLEEAIKAGSVDLQNGMVKDLRTGEVMSLAEAMQTSKIDPTAAKSLLDALDKLSLHEMIQKGQINPDKGHFIPSDKSRPITIQEAMDRGLLHPENVYVVDKENNNIVSLDSLIKSGRFDPKTGMVIDQKTGRAMSLSEAIANGIIGGKIAVDDFVDTSVTLKDLIDSSKVNPRSTTFVAPNNYKMSLRDALANGFLTMNSNVKLDPETGCVVLAADEEIVQALVDVKENSDWISDTERKLASQKKPHQRLDGLQGQSNDIKAVQEDMVRRKTGVTTSIKQAEELIDNNQTDRKEDGAQQIQKLRFNVSDLKIRFNAAFGETESRRKRFQKMTEDLEQFYTTLQDIDQWLDQAIEKSRDLQTSKDNIHNQFNDYKEFVEEIQVKELEIAGVIKMADDFRDTAQEFEKEAEAYRQRIQVLPPIKEEVDNNIIDDEIESLEEKFKDVSRNCSKHMEKLAALMKQKKGFDDLKDKLSSVYPQIEARLSNIHGNGLGKNPEKDTKDLTAVKELKADLIGQDRKLKDLIQSGEKLVKGLNDINMKQKAEEVKESMAEMKDKHESLQSEIGEKEEELSSAVSQQQNLRNRLDGLQRWMSETESALENRPLISLDKDKLAQQLKEQRLLNGEIETNKTLLERISQETGQNAPDDDAEGVILELSERMVEVEKDVDQITMEIEDVACSVSELENNIGQMDSWLTDAISSLKTRQKGANQKAVKAKIDALYNDKREKEYDMEKLRQSAKEIMDDERVCDQFAMKEYLGEVEVKWHELTEHLVQQVSLEALTEIDGMLKYLDKAENEINTAEPVNVEPETLNIQLHDHQSFNMDLNQKRNAVKDIINKCNRMLRETTNAQTDEIKSRLESIKTQADIVCQLSAERLHQLESALPLATHFSENQAEIHSWLDEMEADLKAHSSPGNTLEQVKKQLDNIKDTQQKIEDRKPFLEDLNTTGLELMELCCDDDAGEIQTKLLKYNEQYEKLKGQAREKARELTAARSKMTQEVSDSLDHVLGDLAQLNRDLATADPIAASPDKLRDEIRQNNILLEDLENQRPAIAAADEAVKRLIAQGVEDPAEAEDLKLKLAEIATLNNQTREGALKRERDLSAATTVAEKFFDSCNDTMSNLRDLKDNFLSQEPPGVDSSTVEEQQKELKELRKELGKARLSYEECRQLGEELSGLCSDPGLMEIRKQLEDIHVLADDVHDIARDREEDLKKALGHTEKFQELQEAIMTWLPLAEQTLDEMETPSSNPQNLKTQIEELKSSKSDIQPHVADVQQLNQELSTLKDMSPVAAEALQRPVEEINHRWAALLKGITDRETKLSGMQLKLGELEAGINDSVDNLENIQSDLEKFEGVNGDPKCLETYMKKLQVMNNDLKNQDKMCKKLSSAVDAIQDAELKEKRDVMNEQLRATQAHLRDKEAKLQEKLRQVKKYLGEVDDAYHWVNDFRNELKAAPPCGALPESSKKQFDAFMAKFEELESRTDATQGLIAKGQELAKLYPPEDVAQITEKIKKLGDRWKDTQDRAEKRKDKLSEHLQNVGEFHDTLKGFMDWLNNAEIAMRSFKYPSKLVEKVTVQIEEHNKLKTELEQHIEKMQSLEKNGSYLKHFGKKQDTIYIKNLLVGIKLRWKKLMRRTDERGRLLKSAYREDKRFYDAWKDLCDWLDESSKTVTRFMVPVNQGSATKQNIDDLKNIKMNEDQMKTESKKIFPCILCKKRTRPNDRKKCESTAIRRFLRKNFLVEANSNDILCNKCRHRYHGNQKTCQQKSSSLPVCQPLQPGMCSPPSISLPLQRTPSSHAYCLICKRPGPKLVVVSSAARFSAFLHHEIIIPPGSRCCPSHIDEGEFRPGVLTKIQTFESSFVNKSTVLELIQKIRNYALQTSTSRFSFELSTMSNSDYMALTGISKENFEDLHSFISSDIRNTQNRGTRMSLGIFLLKLRSGMSNQLLATIFGISKSSLCRAVKSVRTALMKSFVPHHLGLARNNDATILNHMLHTNVEDLKGWFHEDDVFVVDRGFRDSVDMLEELGIRAEMPRLMSRGQKQMTTLDANASRLVTKIRWVVEAANARIKRWKYLAHVLPTNQVPFIGDYVRIVCALSNRYCKPLSTGSEDEDMALACKMRYLSTKVNSLKTFVEENCLDKKSVKWEVATDSLEFPNISEDDIRNLTCGVYQLKLCPSYIQEYLEGDVDILVHSEFHGLIRVKLQSRHVSSRQYLLWIQFSESDITAWYCRCRAGARVVGVCSHVAAVIWFLAVGRHNREAISSIQDWSEFVTDAAVIDESEDSDDSEVEE